MNALVDTSVWSLAYRRAADLNSLEKELREELSDLIQETRVRIIGPVCQELLSGIRDRKKFEVIWRDMASFYEEPLTSSDYRRGADVSNQLRANGITGTLVDCLICAVAIDRGFSVFTVDDDFRDYAKHLPLLLHTPR